MRVGVLGRTGMLINAARAVAERGHQISFVQTCGTGRYQGAEPADFARLAADVSAPFLTSAIRHSAEAWRETATGVCISINWPTLIPVDMLDLFPHGILNAHAGDLPRYRGNACPNWAILNGETQIGLTVHRMVPELDAGPWLCKAFMPLDDSIYIGDVYAWLERAVPPLFCEALERLQTTRFRPQDPAIRPLRSYPRRPEDARIDWTRSSAQILALIRASSRPFDGAFTTLEGQRTLRIWRASAVPLSFDALAVPGQVCMAHGEDPVIATNDGMIQIQDCSMEELAAPETKRAVLSSLRNRLI